MTTMNVKNIGAGDIQQSEPAAVQIRPRRHKGEDAVDDLKEMFERLIGDEKQKQPGTDSHQEHTLHMPTAMQKQEQKAKPHTSQEIQTPTQSTDSKPKAQPTEKTEGEAQKKTQTLNQGETAGKQRTDKPQTDETTQPAGSPTKPQKADQTTRSEDTSPAQKTANAILQSMFSHIKAPETADSPKADPAEKPAARSLVEVASQIADRILVSEKKADGSQEIRIHLKSDILPDTEVRITKENNTLHVSFHTGDSGVQKLLSEHKTELSNHLVQKLDVEVKVEVIPLSHQTGGGMESNSDGRSRGRFDYYEEPEET